MNPDLLRFNCPMDFMDPILSAPSRTFRTFVTLIKDMLVLDTDITVTAILDMVMATEVTVKVTADTEVMGKVMATMEVTAKATADTVTITGMA